MDLFRTTSRIASLARSGLIKSARELFDGMPERDTVAWNAMLTGYARSGLPREALSVFSDMRSCGAGHDDFTLTAVLSASAAARDLHSGRKVHALAVSSGFGSSLPVCNSLVDMYGKCSRPAEASSVFARMGERNDVSWCSLLFAYASVGDCGNARRTFDAMPLRRTIAWNILLWGYSQLGEIELCVDRFKEMQLLGLRGDVWTFSSLMYACTGQETTPSSCRAIHACTVKNGLNLSAVIGNTLLSCYAKIGWTGDAIKVFESMKLRTSISWNAMIDAHMKVGKTQEALSLFLKAPEKNLVSWTCMIGGYARNGNGEEALSFFVSVMRNDLLPDEFTFGSVLHACASLAVLGHGRMVHGSVICRGFAFYVYVGNGLIDMYVKCGDLPSSSQVFDGMRYKDLVSCNIMLFGFGLHGWASNAFSVYEEMLVQGVSPDKVTFIGLLMACSHAGLIEQGCLLFEKMKSVHGVLPDFDHLTCAVDMLGRAGHLKEAKQLLKDYGMLLDEGSTDSCEALLGACVVHGDFVIGSRVGKELVTMDPLKDVGYVILSNMYCSSGQWEEAERVRRAMTEQGVKKSPGCSWIEVKNMVAVFVSGVHSLPHMTNAYTLLDFLASEMKRPCFIQ